MTLPSSSRQDLKARHLSLVSDNRRDWRPVPASDRPWPAYTWAASFLVSGLVAAGLGFGVIGWLFGQGLMAALAADVTQIIAGTLLLFACVCAIGTLARAV